MTIYIIDLESVPSRYTCEWKTKLPLQLQRATNESVEVISGDDTVYDTTPGAFLNFASTNAYKSKQMEIVAEKFNKSLIKNNDYFLFTDAWNPTVLQLKYMSSLLDINIKIGGIWHAGAYDPQDFLGRKIGNQSWVQFTEKALYNSYDHNFFATDFHINLFLDYYKDLDKNKIFRVGWPMEYLNEILEPYKGIDKEDIILFPHRIAPEKQLDIFKDLEKSLPEYNFIVCQDKPLSKKEYHSLLAKSKIIFSANLQETLGISWYEGCLVNTLPLVPNRLSYYEMSLDKFKYPSEWTISFNEYLIHKEKLINKIHDMMNNYSSYIDELTIQVGYLQKNYFNGNDLYIKIGE